MNINYGMEIVRATEMAALTAARIQGLGDSIEILNSARLAITKSLGSLQINGTIINDRCLHRADMAP